MSRICPITSSVPRLLGAAYVPILLSDVEQEQRPSKNGDREAIVEGSGLGDGEGERAYTGYDPHFSFGFYSFRSQAVELSGSCVKNVLFVKVIDPDCRKYFYKLDHVGRFVEEGLLFCMYKCNVLRNIDFAVIGRGWIIVFEVKKTQCSVQNTAANRKDRQCPKKILSRVEPLWFSTAINMPPS